MGDYDWAAIGQGVVAILFMAGGAYRLIQGHKGSKGEAPASRAPSPHEVTLACEKLEKHLERIHTKIERHMEITEDDVRDIKRQLDALESAVRLLTAVSDIERRYGRQPKGNN